MSKPSILLFAAILVGAIVLSVAIRGQLAEKRQLEEDFTAAQNGLARDAAEDLGREWEELAEDGHLVAALATQMNTVVDNSTMNRDIIGRAGMFESFRALATVVRYYRSITFVPRDGSPPTSAIDPSEKHDLSAWLLDLSMHVARRGVAQRGRRTEGPFRAADGREFLFHSETVGESGAVVLGVDARRLLQRVLRMAAQDGRFVILDHADGLWLGCGAPAQCSRKARSEWRPEAGFAGLVSIMRKSERGAARAHDEVAKAVGITGRTAQVAWHSFKAGDASWSLAAVVSPDALQAREGHLVWRLVLTSAALALSLGGISFIGFRLQRRQAELHERIRYMQQQAHLREQTEKIFNSVPVGIIGIGSDGRVASVNRFVMERLAPVAVGVAVDVAFPTAGHKGARRLRDLITEACRARQQLMLRQPDVDTLAPRPGQFEIRVVPIEDPTGELSALVLVEDFAEVRKLERQLLRAEKLATVGVLTAGLAHEIGTPLGIIRVRAETLLESVPAGDDRNLSSILGQIDRIATIIRQLLDFSRQQPVEPRPTSVSAVAGIVADLLAWRLQQKHLQLRIVSEEPGLSVAADPDQLQQVLVNLLINACDACAEGGHITIRVGREAGASQFVRMEVEDDGCGIAPEHVNAVFDPFFTTKKRGEGTGLGLPVVASIVRNHGGHVSISSELNRKTIVAVLWPAAKEGVKAHE